MQPSDALPVAQRPFGHGGLVLTSFDINAHLVNAIADRVGDLWLILLLGFGLAGFFGWDILRLSLGHSRRGLRHCRRGGFSAECEEHADEQSDNCGDVSHRFTLSQAPVSRYEQRG
jgi:hypothetical protein